MSMIYKLFYRKHGIRKIAGFISPSPLRLLSLPRGSIYHYYSTDEEKYPVDTSLSFLSMSKHKTLVDFTTDYTEDTRGIYKKKPFIARAATKNFFKDNKAYRYVPNHYASTSNEHILLIQNYSYLNAVYRYTDTPMTAYYRWYNMYKTIFSTISSIASSSNRQHFLHIELPIDIPSHSMMQLYRDKENLQMLKLFSTHSSYLFLELWKWVDDDFRATSVFSSIQEDRYPLINIIFRYGDTETLINLGYLDSFIKGHANTTEFSSAPQYPSQVIKKLLLRFVLNMKSLAVDSALTDTDEDEVSDATAAIDNDSDTPDTEVGIRTVEKPAPVEVGKTVEDLDYEEILADIDVDAELKALDKDLDDYNKLYMLQLIRKGIDVDSKDSVKTPEPILQSESDIPTKEQLEEKLYKSIDPVAKLSADLENLAEKDALRVTDYRKFRKYIDSYTAGPNVYSSVPVSSAVVYTQEDIELTDTKSTAVLSDVVADKSMAGISMNSLSKDYLDKLYHKDIVSAVYSIQKAGVVVKSHTMESKVSVLGDYEYHRLELAPIDGASSTISFKLPKISSDDTFTVASNKLIMRRQRVDLPIRKISPTKVSLSTYYGKNFVELSRLKAHSSTDYTTKQIFKKYTAGEILDLSPGDAYDNYFEAPYVYSAIANSYKGFRKDDVRYMFDRKEIEEVVPEKVINTLEQNSNRVCGLTDTGGYVFVDKDSLFYKTDGSKQILLGDIYEVLDIPVSKVPVDYSEFRVYSKYLPVGLILGYLLGIDTLISLLGASYRILDKNSSVDRDEYAIRFKDGVYAFSRSDTISSKILSGFTLFEKTLKRMDFDELNHKDGYFALFEEKEITSVYIKEIELTNELFIDPISESILREMNEPTTFVGLLVRATEMLSTYTYPDSQDLTQMRIRGYERVAGFVYKELAKSVKMFKNKNINGRSKVELSPYAVWSAITDDNSIKLVEDINPLQDIKERDTVTYVGEGGRDKDSIQKEARAFHVSDFGVISEANVDSGDVGVNTYVSANPSIKNLRGITKELTEISTTNVMSASANLAPFSVMDD